MGAWATMKFNLWALALVGFAYVERLRVCKLLALRPSWYIHHLIWKLPGEVRPLPGRDTWIDHPFDAHVSLATQKQHILSIFGRFEQAPAFRSAVTDYTTTPIPPKSAALRAQTLLQRSFWMVCGDLRNGVEPGELWAYHLAEKLGELQIWVPWLCLLVAEFASKASETNPSCSRYWVTMGPRIRIIFITTSHLMRWRVPVRQTRG